MKEKSHEVPHFDSIRIALADLSSAALADDYLCEALEHGLTIPGHLDQFAGDSGALALGQDSENPI